MSTGQIPPIVLTARDETAQAFTSARTNLSGLRSEAQAAAAALGRSGEPLEKVGMSARATAAAMRQVPAQMQDIVVSLQGGQRPLTVLLQQGSQLSSMFGGTAAAMKAVGSYAMGLVSPLSMAGTAAAALGLAFYQGSKEASAFNNMLAVTGNVSGATVAQLQGMARAMADNSRTQSAAAAALNEMAQSSGMAAEHLQRYTTVAMEWEKATGTAISKTGEAFRSLEEAPLKAALELNKGVNYLTTSTYEQIKALDEQGRRTDAARVAQESYADSLNSRTQQVTDNQGWIERGWNAVTTSAKKAWDAMLGVGRAATQSDRLADIDKQLSDLTSRASNQGFGTNAGGAAFGRPDGAAVARMNERIEALRAERAEIVGAMEDERKRADQQAENAARVKALSAWDQSGEQYLEKRKRMDREIAAATVQGQELVNAGLIKEADLRERINAIREKYAERGGSASKAEGAAAKQLAQDLSALAEIAGLTPSFYKDWEQLNDLHKRNKISVDELTQAQANLLAKQPVIRDEAEKQTRAQEELNRARDKFLADQGKYLKGIDKELEQEEARNETLKDEIQRIGMSTRELTAHEQARLGVVIAKKEERLATIAQMDASAEETSKLIRQIEILKERQALLGQRTDKTLHFEEIKRAGDEYKRIVEQYEQGLMNAAMQGGKSLKEYITGMLRTTAFRIVLQPVMGAMSGILAGVTGGAGGQSGWLGAANNAHSMYSLFSGYNQTASAIGSMLGYGNAAGASAGTLGYANTVNALGGDGLGALIAGNAGWAGVSTPVVGYGGAASMYTTSAMGGLQSAPVITGFGGTPIGVGAGSVPIAQTGGWASSGAAAAGVLALPIAVGLLAGYLDKGDSFSGAAYATSGGNDRMTEVIAGALHPNLDTGDLPDRAALEARLIQLGATNNQFVDRNDRTLHRMMLLAEAEMTSQREGGAYMNWGEWGKNNASLADFYRGAGYAFPEELGWWEVQDKGRNYREWDSFYTDPAITAVSRQISEGILAPIMSISGALGRTDDYKVASGMAYNDKTGKIWGGLQMWENGESVMNWGRRDFDNQSEYLRATFADAMDVLGQFDLPNWAQTQVSAAQEAMNQLSGDKMGEEAAALYQRAGAEITGTMTAISRLINIVPELGGASQDAVYNIGQAMGGLESFVSTYSGYIQNFYTEAERVDYIRSGINEALSEFDLSVVASTTRDEFRGMVEAQDLATESGQRAFAALMSVSTAFAEITPSAAAVADALATLREQASAAASEIGANLTGVITEGLLGNLSSADLGGQMADVVVGGVYNALASNVGGQISSMMMNTVVSPLLTAAMTGASVAESVTQAAINSMVANAQAAAQALNSVLSSPEFKEALSGIDGAIRSISVSMPTTSYYNSYASQQAYQNQQKAASDAAKASANAAKAAADALKASQDAAYSALQRAIDAEKKRVQTALEAARTVESETKSVFDFLHGEVRDLYGQVDATAAMHATAGRSFIDEALRAYNSIGTLPQEEELREAVSAIRSQIDANQYVRTSDQEFARLVLAGQLDVLRGGAETQLSTAEQQVELLEEQVGTLDQTLQTAKDQLDALRGIDTSVLSMAEALRQFGTILTGGATTPGTTSTAAARNVRYPETTPIVSPFQISWTPVAPKSFDVGTNWVPYDMTAQIHRGERIIPEADNSIMIDIMRKGASNDAMLSALRAVRAEVAALRNQMREPNAAMSRMARQFENVTDGGNAMRAEVMNQVEVKVEA